MERISQIIIDGLALREGAVKNEVLSSFLHSAFLVENAGLEPVTSCMSSKRSNLLS